ncbi:hypothetical protein ACOSQ3_024495 [Xanthoceras sorbifolium]
MNKKEIFKLAKGFRGRAKNCIRIARERVEKALQYSYRDRRNKKRDMRSLWIQRINAGTRQHGVNYGNFMHGLNKENIQLNRKVLKRCQTSPLRSVRAGEFLVSEVKPKPKPSIVFSPLTLSAAHITSPLSSHRHLAVSFPSISPCRFRRRYRCLPLSPSPLPGLVACRRFGFLRRYPDFSPLPLPRLQRLPLSFAVHYPVLVAFGRFELPRRFVFHDAADLSLSRSPHIETIPFNFIETIQEHLAPSGYLKIPTGIPAYLKGCTFLPQLNNELAGKRNSTFKERFSSLENLVLIMRPPCLGIYYPDGSFNAVLPAQQTPLYTEDWIGLKTLDEAGKDEASTQLTIAGSSSSHTWLSSMWNFFKKLAGLNEDQLSLSVVY